MVAIDIGKLPDETRHAVEKIFSGEEVTFQRDGVTVAKIEVVAFPANSGRRVFGRHRGQTVLPADFNEPLPDEFWTGGTP